MVGTSVLQNLTNDIIIKAGVRLYLRMNSYHTIEQVRQHNAFPIRRRSKGPRTSL
jgi:hypothetical protein